MLAILKFIGIMFFAFIAVYVFIILGTIAVALVISARKEIIKMLDPKINYPKENGLMECEPLRPLHFDLPQCPAEEGDFSSTDDVCENEEEIIEIDLDEVIPENEEPNQIETKSDQLTHNFKKHKKHKR